MGSNPINLLVRFILEIAGLLAMGWWGWNQAEGVSRFFLAIGIPLLAAGLWGTFAVPNDPSRSGKSPVPVPGFLRLLLELGFFAFAIWSLFAMEASTLGLIFGIAVLVHYLVSYDRVAWLLRQRRRSS